LQSIENFFGLVNDQVVTMPTPEHISSLDFDSLLSSIEITKEILEETTPMVGTLESMSRNLEGPEAQPEYRPPMRQSIPQ